MTAWLAAAAVPADLWPDASRLDTATVDQLLETAQGQVIAYAPALDPDAAVPVNYLTALVMQARELYGASQRTGDSELAGDAAFPIRIRPLSDAVRTILRPPNPRPRFGGAASTTTPDVVLDGGAP